MYVLHWKFHSMPSVWNAVLHWSFSLMVSKLGGVEEPFSSETQMEWCLEMLFVGHIGMKTHVLTVLEKPIDVFLFQCNSMLTNCEVFKLILFVCLGIGVQQCHSRNLHEKQICIQKGPSLVFFVSGNKVLKRRLAGCSCTDINKLCCLHEQQCRSS